jgi:hypothetical protein
MAQRTGRQTGLAAFAVVWLCTAALAEGPARVLTLPIPHDAEDLAIGVTVSEGLRSMARVPTEPLRVARRAMQAGQEIAPDDLRALAELGDGLAAQRLVKHLQMTAGSDSDVARFAGIAVATGRIGMLPAMVDALGRLDPATEPPDRIAGHVAALYPQAWAGNPLALEALVQLNGAGRLFGALSDKTRQRLEAMAEDRGDGRLYLTLALNEMSPGGDAARAEGYVRRAAEGSNPMVRMAAETLIANRGLAMAGTGGAP